MFIAGGIGRGDAVLAYWKWVLQAVNSARCSFATESIAHENFAKAFIRASARCGAVVQLDPQFPSFQSGLSNDATREFQQTQRDVIDAFDRGEVDQTEAQLKIENYWAGALRRGCRR